MHSLSFVLLFASTSLSEPASTSISTATTTRASASTFAPARARARTLTLGEAIDLAIAADPELAKSEIGHDRSRLTQLRAELDRFRFTVDAQLQELWTRANLGGDREGALEGGLGLSNVSANLTVPIFSGFRVESNIARADHLERAARYDVLDERRAIAISVARAYWAVRRIALLADVERGALDRIRNAERIAGARLRAGLSPPIDKSRVEARRLLAEDVIADLDGAGLEASERLAVLLDLPEEVVLVDLPRAPQPPSASLDRLLSVAHEMRPEMKAARARVEAQHEAVRNELSAYYPSLSAYSLLQYGNNPSLAGAGSRAVFGSANPFEGMAGDFQVGAVLSINLFDTLNTHTSVKYARFEEARRSRECDQVQRGIDREVRVARARVQRFFARATHLKEAERVSRENVDVNRRRYESGEAMVFELLDSEIELKAVERQRAEVEAEWTVAGIELSAAIGDADVGAGQPKISEELGEDR